jgi:hypothetical protein
LALGVGQSSPGKPSAAAGCTDSPARSLLLPYALSRCGENDALRFEAHVLECETCFQDLKALDRAGTLIQEFLASGGAIGQGLDPRPARNVKSSPPARRAKRQ